MKVFVGDNKFLVNLLERAQAVALWAGAVRIVEREHTRTHFLNRNSVLGAGIIERKQLLVRLVNAADYIDNYNAVADFCCGFNTVGKARFDFGFDNKAVDNNLDIML